MKNKWSIFGALVILALVVIPVLAGIDMEGANAATATPGTTTIAVVDSSDPATSVRPLKVMGNPTLYISLLYSTQASCDVGIRADAYGPDGEHMGLLYSGTVTTASTSSNGRYYATSPIQTDICAGATTVSVRVVSITTGSTVYLKRWVGVANTRGPATE